MLTLLPMQRMLTQLRSLATYVLRSYSELFFMSGLWLGALVCAVSFLHPYAASSGLLCVLSAYACAVFLGFGQQFKQSGAYVYNALMIGMGAVLAFPELSFIAVGFVCVLGVLSFLVTLSATHILYIFFKLPVLSLPFVLVSLLMFWTMPYLTVLQTPTHQPVAAPEWLAAYLPLWFAGFCKALGAIVYSPTINSGLLIALLILWYSRILFCLALAGFVAGSVMMGVLTDSIPNAFDNFIGFNYLLTAMALGAGFTIPSLKSYILAFFAVACNVLIIAAMEHRLPAFTFPFAIVTYVFLYVLHLVGYPLRPVVVKKNPEATLEHFLVASQRYSATPVTLSLPFYGTWSVWQGFDGAWTHQGVGRYAYDFVITDAAGSTFGNQGKLLSDYYCYQQAVLSPVRGRVMQVVNSCVDHPIGSVNTTDHYGNYVLIQDVRGYWVKLAHFAQYGIDVFEGAWVEVGAYLGRCGNSGYSPQPHIHIHVQASAYLGAETIVFRFLNYIQHNQYYEHGLPLEAQPVSQAPPLPYYSQLTTFLLDSSYAFEVINHAKTVGDASPEHVQFQVKMAADHTIYLSCGDSKLYIGRGDGSFYVYHMDGDDPYLRMLYLALPTLPLFYQQGLTWQDIVPSSLVLRGWRKLCVSLLNPIVPQYVATDARYRFESHHVITGVIANRLLAKPLETRIELDPFNKIELITVGAVTLRRAAPFFNTVNTPRQDV